MRSALILVGACATVCVACAAQPGEGESGTGGAMAAGGSAGPNGAGGTASGGSTGAGGLQATGGITGGGGGAAGRLGAGGMITTGTGGSTTGAGGSTTGMGGSNLTCAPFTLPAYSGLTVNAKFPDPFKNIDGTRIARKDQWPCRRAEIAAQGQQYELGAKPGKPATVTGAMSGTGITVTVSDAGKSISFTASISTPAGTGPFPALIAIGGSSLSSVAGLGVASVNFPNDDLAAQVNGGSRGMGKFYTLYGSNHSAGAMMAWAWGVSRLIDALEQTPGSKIDTKRLAVTGCSRNGKGALIAGAFDERIALTIPQESGSGGAASWRVSDAQQRAGANIQTLGEITGENVWFASSFSQFNSTATRLPFDHHMIEGLVAPRALFVIENDIDWLGPVSTFQNSMGAHTVWEALGVPDAMGYSEVGNHAHCSFPASQTADLQAFVKKFLVGNGTDSTAVLKNDHGYTFDKPTWVDWTVPALQ